jgi:DNA-directed RNA polymerase subunit RPC12/RpoP
VIKVQLKIKKQKGDERMPTARCMKCKKEVEVKNPKEVTMKNGLVAIQGVCPVCGTKVFRIIGKKK